MTTRVLPAAEWSRLAGTELAPALAQLPPEAVTAFVVEDAGAVVGCWALVTFTHVEGLWVAPSHRKRGRVLVRLWTMLCELARARQVRAVFTGALTDDVRRLLASRGAEALPPMYVLPIRPLKENV